MSDPTELETADEYCRMLVRRHYENFVAVSFFVRGRQAHVPDPGDLRTETLSYI